MHAGRVPKVYNKLRVLPFMAIVTNVCTLAQQLNRSSSPYESNCQREKALNFLVSPISFGAVDRGNAQHA
jgi:hypothetical protein